MSRIMRKPTMCFLPGCTATEDGNRLEILNAESIYEGIVLSVWRKQFKALISVTVTAKLICAFAFAYEKCFVFS